MKKLLIFLQLFIFFYTAYANEIDTYRIFLKNKGDTLFEQGTQLYKETQLLHSERAIKRRKKVLSENSIFQIEDAPISQNYIDLIEQNGAKVLLKLRWLNYIVVECDSSNIEIISKLPFVKKIQKTAEKITAQTKEINYKKITNCSIFKLNENLSYFNYGTSFLQNTLMETNKLHSLGITGENVLIGFCDTGFRWRTHNALKNIKVLKEWDFINNDSITANEEQDPANQDSHGTLVLSAAGGYYPGELIGIAPSADYILAKTEDMRWERRIEEDAYCSAIEWMEAEGVDIISTSLGYFNFDSTENSYSFNELDGNTTLTAKYVNLAVKKGIVFVTAAGNNGPNPSTIITPADADSVIAVGAIRFDSLLVTNFSSRGPRADGKIKPDLTTLGEKVISASPDEPNKFIEAKGTSLATPLISSSIALILSAFPELKPWQVRELLFRNASKFTSPDNAYGYGIPNIYKAMKDYGIIISPISYFHFKNNIRLLVFIDSKNNLNECSVFLNFGDNSFKKFKLYKSAQDNLYIADIPENLFLSDKAEGYILARDDFSQRRLPYEENRYFEIILQQSKVHPSIDPTLQRYLENDLWASFVFPSVVADRNTEVFLNAFLEESSDAVLELYSSNGAMVYRETINKLPAGISKLEIKTQTLQSGAYFIRFSHKNSTQIFKFIISL